MMNPANLCKVNDRSDIALLLIDVINALDFEGNDNIVRNIPELAKTLAFLKKEVKALGIPVVYVNDNFDKWQSNFTQLLNHCLHEKSAGRIMAEMLTPEDDDFFVLKPKHSGFFCTPLEILLGQLGVKELILTGLAGNICVAYTANDAYMRGYKLFVPEDGMLSNEDDENRYASQQMKKLLKADISNVKLLVELLKARGISRTSGDKDDKSNKSEQASKLSTSPAPGYLAR